MSQVVWLNFSKIVRKNEKKEYETEGIKGKGNGCACLQKNGKTFLSLIGSTRFFLSFPFAKRNDHWTDRQICSLFFGNSFMAFGVSKMRNRS